MGTLVFKSPELGVRPFITSGATAPLSGARALPPALGRTKKDLPEREEGVPQPHLGYSFTS